MHETNIKHLDFHLLLTLKALLEEKHISRAALKINLSQPATSRALGRLREIFQDPLLVKEKNGWVLTERAAAICQPLQLIINQTHALVSPPSIDPASMKGEIVIAARDYESATVLPSIVNHLGKEAPQLAVQLVTLQEDELDSLEKQKVDFILTATENCSVSLYRQVLYEENYICLIAKNNPLYNLGLNLERYLAAKHCTVMTSGYGLSAIDKILNKNHYTRRIALRASHFFAAGEIVANTDLIATLPKRLGEILCRQNQLKMVELPFSVPSFPIYLYWHVRQHGNPAHQWIRGIFKKNYPALLEK